MRESRGGREAGFPGPGAGVCKERGSLGRLVTQRSSVPPSVRAVAVWREPALVPVRSALCLEPGETGSVR